MTDENAAERILAKCRREGLVMRLRPDLQVTPSRPKCMVLHACHIGMGRKVAEGETWADVAAQLWATDRTGAFRRRARRWITAVGPAVAYLRMASAHTAMRRRGQSVAS